MQRRHRHDEHGNHEAWAIPYGDLMTLLLAFFVVMYSMSTLNDGKYRVLSDALNAEFRGPQRSTKPIQVGESQRGRIEDASAIDRGALREGAATATTSANDTKETTKELPTPVPPPTTPNEDVAGNAQELNKVADDIEQAMSTLITEKMVAVRRHGLWIEVEIRTDILFPSGVASLSPLATSLLLPLANSLRPLTNPVRVEGHTDNVPISKRGLSANWPTNWELSAARAASVVRLFAESGVAPTRLTVIGLGEFRPLQSNATADGRNANRRVVLVILGSDGLPVGTYGHQEDSAVGNHGAALPVSPSGH